jgi:hypothetical protein
MTKEAIVDRIHRLLALSNSSNANEAAAAAAQAQKLMERHAISEAMLEAESPEKPEPIENTVLYSSGHAVKKWKNWLSYTVCELNQCKSYRSRGTLRIIGRKSDADTVKYLYLYLVNEIERLSKKECWIGGSQGIVWKNNFCVGACQEVMKRMKEAAAETRREMQQEARAKNGNGGGTALLCLRNALVRLDQRKADVETWASEYLNLRTTNARSSGRVDLDGLQAGMRAGRNIPLGSGPGLPSKGSGGELPQ